MAEIRVRAENGHEAQTITGTDEQQTFLEARGLGFEQWPIDKLDTSEVEEAEDEQAYILETFSDEIERVGEERGYTEADVVALNPDTPDLDKILSKFDKEHRHEGDEVRFVVAGRGIFTIHSDEDDAVFDVEVHPGDLLIVPDGTWHWFTLCEDKKIKCIRLFKDKSGWVPHYREDAEA